MQEDMGVKMGERGTYSSPLAVLGKGPAIALLRNWRHCKREWNKVLQQNFDGAYQEIRAVFSALEEKWAEVAQAAPLKFPPGWGEHGHLAASSSLPKLQTPFPACNLSSHCPGKSFSFLSLS